VTCASWGSGSTSALSQTMVIPLFRNQNSPLFDGSLTRRQNARVYGTAVTEESTTFRSKTESVGSSFTRSAMSEPCAETTVPFSRRFCV